jgi:hypothetical protein
MECIEADGVPAFQIAEHLHVQSGFPLLDWKEVASWLAKIGSAEQRARAWTACERSWLESLRGALGGAFQTRESDTTILLSSYNDDLARCTIEYLDRTVRRILSVLRGVASLPPTGKMILIAFDDQEQYYSYVANYYPDAGAFGLSGGIYISHGCAHLVTVKLDLNVLEPVIVHEATHALLGHLPLPRWLNEGIAVNTERQLTLPRRGHASPQKMHAKHRRYWKPTRIQEYWAGRSFSMTGEAQALSYDLAQIMVDQFATDWDVFARFALAANASDAGEQAAHEQFEVGLGDCVCALLERKASQAWAPNADKIAKLGDEAEQRGD